MSKTLNNIIYINNIREAIPKKRTWYKYYDDIFISVVPESKITPHIRRKATITDNKVDNKTSIWHLNWQYEIIEFLYGINKTGKKTYEIQIYVDNEKHIIDSLVDNIALEFQHTLSVSLTEINSRFIAHKKFGFIPYLILDFTSFYYEYAEFLTKPLHTIPLRLSEALKKWENSEYYKNNNLYIDFGNTIVRYYENKFNKINYKKDYFAENLQKLESLFSNSIEQEKKINKQRLIRQKQIEKEENNFARATDLDFKFFRICLQDILMKNIIEKFKNDNIYYYNYSDTDENIYIKTHNYYSEENEFELIYITYSEKKNKEFKYLYAEIIIKIGKGKNLIIHNYIKENNKTRKIENDNLIF